MRLGQVRLARSLVKRNGVASDAKTGANVGPKSFGRACLRMRRVMWVASASSSRRLRGDGDASFPSCGKGRVRRVSPRPCPRGMGGGGGGGGGLVPVSHQSHP